MDGTQARLPGWLRRLFGRRDDYRATVSGRAEETPVYEQTLSGRQIGDFFERGRYFEIFTERGTPTLMRVTRVHDILVRRFARESSVTAMIERAHAILNAPLHREEWEKGRSVMSRIEKQLGARRFRAREPHIWRSVWKELEDSYHLKPELVSESIERDMARRHGAG
jgi:hypothetical protein